MNKSRLEAFSDGVIAIIITIMVLNLQIPHGANLEALRPVWPLLATYIVSYIFLGIYWSNHHHMLHTVARVNGAILWANLHLLFWLSLIPFITGWVGASDFASVPVAVYGAVLLLAAIAYTILEKAIIAEHGRDSKLASAVGRGVKEKLSLAFYLISIPSAFYYPALSFGFFIVVALMWLVPDRRIEKKLSE